MSGEEFPYVALDDEGARHFGRLVWDTVQSIVSAKDYIDGEQSIKDTRLEEVTNGYIQAWFAIKKHRDRLESINKQLLAACEAALTHVLELEDAWRSGALSEHDGKGGTRSNRNVDIRCQLAAAIRAAREE